MVDDPLNPTVTTGVSTHHSSWPITQVLDQFGWDGRTRGGTDGWASTRCPFHYDRSASASINEELNSFSCFGCGAKGNSVSLIMDVNHLDAAGAVAWLDQHIGTPTDRITEERLPWEF